MMPKSNRIALMAVSAFGAVIGAGALVLLYRALFREQAIYWGPGICVAAVLLGSGLARSEKVTRRSGRVRSVAHSFTTAAVLSVVIIAALTGLFVMPMKFRHVSLFQGILAGDGSALIFGSGILIGCAALGIGLIANPDRDSWEE